MAWIAWTFIGLPSALRASGLFALGSGPARSCVLAHELHEDVLERALLRVEVGEFDAEIAQTPQKRRDAGALVDGVEDVLEHAAVILQRQVPAAERGGDGRERRAQMQGELLLAELLHQSRLLLDDDQLAAVAHGDAGGPPPGSGG